MFQPGLKGITAVQTELSLIDGEKGILKYRGLPIKQLVTEHSFEETAYFLLYGRFPTEHKRQAFDTALKKNRYIPEYTKQIIDMLPSSVSVMDTLRTAISSLPVSESADDSLAQKLIAITPTIIAYRYRQLNGETDIKPDNDLNHAANFMYMLYGNTDETHTRMLETYLILTMEHGLNASTFAARVTISTQSDLISAITSALGTMKGPLHGGAPSGVIGLLEDIKTDDKISEIIHKKLENKERIMGFGHRVYKTIDPRAEALKEKILELDNLPDWMNLALKTEKETISILKQYKSKQKLYTNVEYYAAVIMKSLGIDAELFTPIFSSSRIVGWCAHAIEQADHNTIFRPKAEYIDK
ncbi:citrate/2-methylcitrate synthase [Lentibacillus sp.]|uniref:citrate/2-methylcitrate synthase n=1 Tax=Lentibacillus sp. TaxID=1925746 RepID=UPI002B4B30A4|nr:citrate/2-methylcitrate synthase [Lentibacillus sp.]HLS10015.1 citrate/2-methylcitrate synthase [Lentibacillus sp.]